MTDTTKLADEVDRLAELLESRDLEIAEFHATQLPVAYYMRGYAAALRAAPAAEPVCPDCHGDGYQVISTDPYATVACVCQDTAINGPAACPVLGIPPSREGVGSAGSGAAPIEGLADAIVGARDWMAGVSAPWIDEYEHVKLLLAAARAYQEAAAELARVKGERDEAQMVCGEAYQVVGAMADDLGIFMSTQAEHALDNLSQHRQVHDDVLPWGSADDIRAALAASTPANGGSHAG